MRKAMLVAALLPLALPGCQTWGPAWSEVTGNRFTVVNMFRRPAVIERVDDQGAFATNPIKIEPGTRRLELSAPVPGWSGGSDLKVFMLDAGPCKRYYINAQFQNNVRPEWSPVIDYVEDIAGCTIEPKK